MTPPALTPSSERRRRSRYSPFASPHAGTPVRRSSPRRQSTTQETLTAAPPPRPRKEKTKAGRRRNAVWDYYDSDHEDGAFPAKCKLCMKIINNPKPTKNLRPHLLSDCPNASAAVRAAVRESSEISVPTGKDSRMAIASATSTAESSVTGPVTQAAFQMAVAQFVYSCALPHVIVESLAFKDFIAMISPGMKLPTRQRLGEDLEITKDRVREQVKALICQRKYVSIVTDGWTDTNGANIINFMVVAPEMPSLFWSSWATHSEEHTAKYFAKEMERVIDDIEKETTAIVTAIVTDNASVMRKAWKDLTERCPHIIGGGCAAHVLNLLMGDICKNSAISEVRAKSFAIIRFVRDHVGLLELFKAKQKEVRQGGGEAPGLVLPVPTRWYSLHSSLRSVLVCRDIIAGLFAGSGSAKFLKRYRKKVSTAKKLDYVKSIVSDEQFWENLSTIVRLTEPIVSAIGKLESDTTFLSGVYKWFRSLKYHHAYGVVSEEQLQCEVELYELEQYRLRHAQDQAQPVDATATTTGTDGTTAATADIRAILELEGDEPTPSSYTNSDPIAHRDLQQFIRVQVQKRWDYVHTSAMGAAFYMDPSMDLDDFVCNDFDAAQAHALSLGENCSVTSKAAKAALTGELYKFAADKRQANFVDMHSVTSPRDYWSNKKAKYPMMTKIAEVVFAIPPSSAANMAVVELVSTKSFPQLWKELRKLGWTSKKPTALSVDYRYVPPNGSVNGEEGRDFFTGEKALMAFARRRRLLRLDLQLTHGLVDAALSDPFTLLVESVRVPTAPPSANGAASQGSSPGAQTPSESASTQSTIASSQRKRQKTTPRLLDLRVAQVLAQRPCSPDADHADAPRLETAKPRTAEGGDAAEETAQGGHTAESPTAQGGGLAEDTAEPWTAQGVDTAEDTAEGGHTAEAATAEGADTAQDRTAEVAAAHDPDAVFDTSQFLCGMRDEDYFASTDQDDINMTVQAREDDEESEVEMEEAMEMLFDTIDDPEIGPDGEDDDEDLSRDDRDRLRAMGDGGWTLYNESQSRTVDRPEAPDYYQGASRPTQSSQAFADSPLGLFFYFLPKVLWIKIADETNRYRSQVLDDIARDRLRRQRQRHALDASVTVQTLQEIHEDLAKWKPIQPHELIHFIGLLLARSLSPERTELARHWTVNEDGALPRGTFGRFMSRKRFEDIARFLHLNNNRDDRRRLDRAWKLRPVLQVVEKTFRRGFLLGKRITVDEGMVGSRHKFNPMRVYMSGKPTKWGTKFYMTCCADTAYCSRIEVYCGADSGVDDSITRAVLRNVGKVLHGQPKKRLIITDNFYSSPLLSQELLDRDLYHVGTMRPNRLGWPKNFSFPFRDRPKRVPRGTYRVAVCNTEPALVAVSWADSRACNFIATGCSTKLTTVKRREKNGKIVDVDCPQLVVDYQTGMGGVDNHDQLRLHRYSIQKSVRMQKYYKSLFLGIVDMAMVNGFILHRMHKEKKKEKVPTHADYCIRLHKELLAIDKLDMTRNPVAENLVSAPLASTTHALQQTTETYKNKLRQYLCKVCSAFSDKQHRSFETSFACESCTNAHGGRVALCNKIRPGQTMTCTQIWHETWKNGSMIPNELRKKIRFRKRRRDDNEEKEDE